MNEVTSIVKLLVIDAVLVLICVVILMALSMIKKATYAVYKRNLLSYFANPVGYIFLCAFVATCSAAAFVGLGSTNEFFVTNLANLDLLNGYIQWILLLFIPTITMSLWAEERRLGTDELLLTIPASDWDIVLGKYLASAAIFGISLLVSQISNFVVLALLAKGDVDIGLFVTTYCGYFMMGLAMISLGMVVSFLTKNLAIGFILGVLANVPLVLSHDFSFAEQSFDFFRGVVSLRSFVFFALVIGLGLYLSVVLIGRRHWYGGKDGESKVGHYLFRAIALVMTVVCLSMFFSKNVSMRYDTTTEQISSLSQKTVQLVRDVDEEKVVVVEAFISQDIPEDYAQTKSDLITKLNEFSARGGNRLQVRIFENLEPYSDEAERANEQYGINAVPVTVTERGAMKSEEIFLGAAFTCGLEKVVVPFFDRGIPVEYELIRSIATVSGEQRKKLGIVNTGARLYGGFDMQTMGQTPKQLIVEELEKQYEVVQVDAGSRIEEELDVMLVVQPSSLNQMQLDNVTEAIRKGIPTAIFEDPAPVMIQAVGTSQPNPPRGGGGMFGGGGPPEPKADYQKLFATLGIEMYGRNDMGQFSADVIWQNYNPYKKAQGLPQMSAEWVFISPDNVDADQPFNPDSPVVSGLNQLLLLYPGAIKNLEANGLEFTPLAQTGKQMGVINFQDLSSARDPIELEFLRKSRTAPEVIATLAAWIKAKDYKPITDQTDESATDTADAAAKSSTPENNINVIFVADIDLMGSDFLRIRAQPDMGGEIKWQFDNVTFVLNVIDALAGDDRFIAIRKRQTRHSTLKLVEEKTAAASEAADDEKATFEKEFKGLETQAKTKQQEAMKELNDTIADINKKLQSPDMDEATSRAVMQELQGKMAQLGMKQQIEQRKLDIELEKLQRDRDGKLAKIKRDLDKEVEGVQNVYKSLAVFIPIWPPLILGAVVFFRRWMLERGTITDARRR